MILQALTGYYDRVVKEGNVDIAREGFEQKEIPFIVIINRKGQFVDFQDTRDGEGKVKRGRLFTVPRGVKKTSGVTANLLWDTPNYVFGQPKSEEKSQRAKEEHRCFVETIKKRFAAPFQDEGISALINFLDRHDFDAAFSHKLWNEIKDTWPNLTFRLDGELSIICCRSSAVIERISEEIDQPMEKQICLVSGNEDTPVLLHHAIKGVHNAQTSGANIVSFNLAAFKSFGKNQGLNAPVGRKAEFAYTTALNHMLSRESGQKLQVGDATVVFWAEKKNNLEDVFATIFGESPKGEPEQDYKSVIALFRSPETGAIAELDPNTRFYVLGLAPNASRLAIRFWYAGTVGSIADNLERHFDDLEMVRGPKEWRTVSLRSLLRSTARGKDDRQKDDNVLPNLAGDTMKAVLAGTPYPKTLLVAAIQRCRAEREVTYTRAALIKAYLSRDTRYHEQGAKEVGMSLDVTNTNSGYLMGRLFAVLEKIQEETSPDINATIRDRFYGSASSTPVTAFPHLMKLKNYHLAKLENRGRAVNLEKRIGEIVDKLDADKPFPAHLSLADQGRFAVGYYHQRQAFFIKRDQESIK